MQHHKSTLGGSCAKLKSMQGNVVAHGETHWGETTGEEECVCGFM